MRLNAFRSAIWPTLGTVLLLALCLAPIAAAEGVEQFDTGCAPGVAPSFARASAMATLKARLGDAMGEPRSCLFTDPATGDGLQWTATGIGAYRKANDLVTFTNGDQHWALTPHGVVQWDDGTLLPEVIPPTAVPLSVPADQHGIAHCGVDLLTHLEAHIDVAGGKVTSSSTSQGLASGCFESNFRACTPASMTTYLIFASYRSHIVGPTRGGNCQVVSTFLDNPNSAVLGQAMICELDNRRPFAEASQDHTHCAGPLYDFIWGTQDAD